MAEYVITEKLPCDNGEAWRGLDQVNESNVIVKWIPSYRANEYPEFRPHIETIKPAIMPYELNHDNIVRLLDVMYPDELDLEYSEPPTKDVCFVYEDMDLDLSKFIHDTSKDELNLHAKSFLFQMLQALVGCCLKNYYHGELKPQNFLIDIKSETVKLADLNYSISIRVRLPQYTQATLAYKAPEMLLGLDCTHRADVWSVGCIFAEMMGKKVLFEGTTDEEIMEQIISIIGYPDEKDCPGVTSACLKLYKAEKLPSVISRRPLSEVFSELGPQGLKFLSRMLCWNPERRLCPPFAVLEPYFEGVQGYKPDPNFTPYE